MSRKIKLFQIRNKSEKSQEGLYSSEEEKKQLHFLKLHSIIYYLSTKFDLNFITIVYEFLYWEMSNYRDLSVLYLSDSENSNVALQELSDYELSNFYQCGFKTRNSVYFIVIFTLH